MAWVAAAAAMFASLGAAVSAASDPPNDPHYEKQSYLQQIAVPAAWEYIASRQTELAPVTIAVVDTGVDLKQPDLQGRLAEGTNILRPGQAPHLHRHGPLARHGSLRNPGLATG